ncbi:hypothetical protein CAAN1_10S04544 [[Candida] anglica]|uniref:Uncharacterized protein n=1 Tax=[Candida] anglica TaxID=148631 RepID=A0ABP0EEP8_9ASCO
MRQDGAKASEKRSRDGPSGLSTGTVGDTGMGPRSSTRSSRTTRGDSSVEEQEPPRRVAHGVPAERLTAPQGKRDGTLLSGEPPNKLVRPLEQTSTGGTSNSAISGAKERLREKRAAAAAAATVVAPGASGSSGSTGSSGTTQGGLSIELHPLLRNMAPTKASANPVKQRNVRSMFDPSAINPYLDQAAGGTIISRPSRPLQFNPRGKYIAQGDQMRRTLAQEQRERDHFLQQKDAGLTANEALAEHLYKIVPPPTVEWWDKPYLRDPLKGYVADLEDTSSLVLDNEDAPVSLYIQHPVFLAAPWERHEEASIQQKGSTLMLTPKERKRLRRNNRLSALQDKQDRIKLGLDPPPPPKVKLSNLMNVLTNEAIQDPTAVEMRVRQEVEERFETHMRANDARKLTREQRHAKDHAQRDKDLQRGYHTVVFKIDSLANGQHFYKLDLNAKQLELVGICLCNPKFNLVVATGGEKAIKFYKKLLTQRIKWTEYVKPKEDQGVEGDANVDLSTNRCTLIWEGQSKELGFKKWSIMRSRDDDEALQVLHRFNVENHWRQAEAIHGPDSVGN